MPNEVLLPIKEKADYMATDLARMYNDELLGWVSQSLITLFGKDEAIMITERLSQMVDHDCKEL